MFTFFTSLGHLSVKAITVCPDVMLIQPICCPRWPSQFCKFFKCTIQTCNEPPTYTSSKCRKKRVMLACKSHDCCIHLNRYTCSQTQPITFLLNRIIRNYLSVEIYFCSLRILCIFLKSENGSANL